MPFSLDGSHQLFGLDLTEGDVLDSECRRLCLHRVAPGPRGEADYLEAVAIGGDHLERLYSD
jgi:hypothetical protein